MVHFFKKNRCHDITSTSTCVLKILGLFRTFNTVKPENSIKRHKLGTLDVLNE